MTNLNNRVSKLEQQSGTTRYYVVTGDNEGNVHIERTPVQHHEDEHLIFTEAQFQQWKAEQPDAHIIIEIVYPDGGRAGHGFY